jgi:hypothetical protein
MARGFLVLSSDDANRRAPPIRLRKFARGAARAWITLTTLALAGCSTGFGIDQVYTGSLWVQPGKYDFLKCPELAQRSIGASNREKELRSLMERASQDTGGSLVNAMVYSADLQQVRADLDQLQQTARQKGCDNLVPNKK